MKKQFLTIALILASLFCFSQGQITFGQDTVNIMGKLNLMKMQQGALTDSLIGKKLNGSTTRLSMNQITPSFSNIIGKPSTLAGYGIIDAYPLTGNPSNFLTSAPVSSVFGRTGSITAQSGDYTTTTVSEGTRLYFTEPRVLSTVLTGYVAGSNTPITASNSVLVSFQNLQAQITIRGPAVNNATIGLSKSVLNSTYPNTPVGYMVLCPNILLGGAVYIRATTGATGTWQTISAPPTL